MGARCPPPTGVTPSRSAGDSWSDGRRPRRAEMAGALLHDVGKVQSGLGTWGRVAATVVGPRTRRFRQYHDHEQIGASMAAQAGIRPGRPWPSSAVTDRPPPTSGPPTTASDRAPPSGEESCHSDFWGRIVSGPDTILPQTSR